MSRNGFLAATSEDGCGSERRHAGAARTAHRQDTGESLNYRFNRSPMLWVAAAFAVGIAVGWWLLG